MISIINAKIVNEGRIFSGSLKINGDTLAEVTAEGTPFTPEGEIIDAQGAYVMPGVIDEHVHFREPGFSYKETIKDGSYAGAHGGYTVLATMPNLKPVSDTVEHINLQKEIIKQNKGHSSTKATMLFYFFALILLILMD